MPLYAERPYLIVVVPRSPGFTSKILRASPTMWKVAIYNGTTCSVTARINA